MNQLVEIVKIAGTYPDGQVLFDEPLQVKSTPHRHIFTAYGVWSGSDGIYVLDGGGDWHGPLHEKQANAGFVICSLYQRLKALPAQPSVVVANYDQEVNVVIFE
jgi:hypothetical protein